MFWYILLLIVLLTISIWGHVLLKRTQREQNARGCTCEFTWWSWHVEENCPVHEFVYKNM
jgi:hypothetical protein